MGYYSEVAFIVPSKEVGKIKTYLVMKGYEEEVNFIFDKKNIHSIVQSSDRVFTIYHIEWIKWGGPCVNDFMEYLDEMGMYLLIRIGEELGDIEEIYGDDDSYDLHEFLEATQGISFNDRA